METVQLSLTWLREDGVEVDATIEVRGPAGLVQRRAAEVMAQLQPVRRALPANTNALALSDSGERLLEAV